MEYEYATPDCAPGNEWVVMERAGALVLTETLALAFFVVSATLVTVTVTLVLLVTVGAVNNPLLEIVPAVADHVTAVLPVPCTVAENGWVFPDAKLALVGEMDTVIGVDPVPLATVICHHIPAMEPRESVT